MTPAFKVLAAGVNITPQIKDRLLGLVVSDQAGFKSDTVEITLDDRDNAIELPLPGAPLAVFMGYEETFLVPMGIYTADEVVAKGPPDTVTIRGKAANLGGSIKEQKTRAWDQKTIEEIAPDQENRQVELVDDPDHPRQLQIGRGDLAEPGER